MNGRRVDHGEVWRLKPGEYGRDERGIWYGVPPQDDEDLLACFEKHKVEVHDDGTITVSPSILVGAGSKRPQWHGYLEHGQWRQV